MSNILCNHLIILFFPNNDNNNWNRGMSREQTHIKRRREGCRGHEKWYNYAKHILILIHIPRIIITKKAKNRAEKCHSNLLPQSHFARIVVVVFGHAHIIFIIIMLLLLSSEIVIMIMCILYEMHATQNGTHWPNWRISGNYY